eukprot:3941952-Rhodomonas_salina.7
MLSASLSRSPISSPSPLPSLLPPPPPSPSYRALPPYAPATPCPVLTWRMLLPGHAARYCTTPTAPQGRLPICGSERPSCREAQEGLQVLAFAINPQPTAVPKHLPSTYLSPTPLSNLAPTSRPTYLPDLSPTIHLPSSYLALCLSPTPLLPQAPPTLPLTFLPPASVATTPEKKKKKEKHTFTKKNLFRSCRNSLVSFGRTRTGHG